MNSKKHLVFLVAILSLARCQTKVGDTCVENYTKTIGKCTPAEDCTTARNDYQLNGIRPTFCTYSAFGTTLVCCRDGSSILNTDKPKTQPPLWSNDSNRPSDTRRVSERTEEASTYPADEGTTAETDQVKRTLTIDDNSSRNVSPREEDLLAQLWAMKFKKLSVEQKKYAEKIINDVLFEADIECEEYSREVVERVDFIPLLPNPEIISLTSAKCDYIGVQLIVGGEKASQGEFPHMAAIGWANFDGGYDFKCGGSLISNKFVLTAGHCIRDPGAREPSPVVVRLGDQNIDPSVLDGADPIEVPIKQIHKHPEYKPPSKYNDIALLELASEVSFESTIRPACLWTRPDFAEHTMAIATGWGVTDPDTRQTSKELHKVSLSLFNNNYCDQLLVASRNRLWQGFRDSQMCAGELRGGKDTCQGDSGSPLQVVSKENQCIFNIIGITSFGVKCAKAGQPAIYTRVSNYLNWIESVVWPGE